ncbi:hypothetical protein K1719_003367 [Acacia pycnantha]|nr:hypothetical protein K1719_003367 [Acacia pycnantha]
MCPRAAPFIPLSLQQWPSANHQLELPYYYFVIKNVKQFPYLDLRPLLPQVVSSFGANRVMWVIFPMLLLNVGIWEPKKWCNLFPKRSLYLHPI